MDGFRNNIKKTAFTLIELLVVISIIALLLSIIMPALNRAKELTRAVICTSNQGQISKAWFMYAHNNNDSIVDGDTEEDWDFDGYSTYLDIRTGDEVRTANFVSIPQDENGNPRNSSLEDKIRGFKKGGLWAYFEDYKLYRCPSDKRYLSPPAVDPHWSFPNTMGGYRSYSMGGVLSRWGWGATLTGEDKHVVTKLTEFKEPVRKIVWIEEADGFGFNHRTWNIFLNRERWYDPFAIWHYNTSSFGFADGHAERHKWQEEETIQLAKEQEKLVDCPGSVDYQWFKRAYIPR